MENRDRKESGSSDGGSALGREITPAAGVPILDRQRSFTGRYSLQPVDEDESPRPTQDEEKAFSSALREIEIARLPMLKSLKTVMLGTSAILHPEQREPGEGPKEVDLLIDKIRDSENKLSRSDSGGSFILRDLPRFSDSTLEIDRGAVPSFTSGNVKYLFSGKNPSRVGLGVAVSLEDYLAVRFGEYGDLIYESRKSFGVKPFFCMPPRAVSYSARHMEEHLSDHGGYGYYLPGFVKLYSEFIAFALQDHPAILAAHLLGKRYPGEAKEMIETHNRLVSRVSSSMLHFLGYELVSGGERESMSRRERDNEVLRSCGLRLFDSLVNWRDHCCRSRTQEEFARSYLELDIEKTSDLSQYLSSRVTVPPQP